MSDNSASHAMHMKNYYKVSCFCGSQKSQYHSKLTWAAKCVKGGTQWYRMLLEYYEKRTWSILLQYFLFAIGVFSNSFLYERKSWIFFQANGEVIFPIRSEIRGFVSVLKKGGHDCCNGPNVNISCAIYTRRIPLHIDWTDVLSRMPMLYNGEVRVSVGSHGA